ncbi:flagellar export chaperone FliS [Uliginosibacterium sp. sgz301328]|uniref:flagellar export chaperone FliS n=1 Tax=Uliginosibacterium sp. sgz301328 TaxID=3243764 RepID=UPI00359CF67F
MFAPQSPAAAYARIGVETGVTTADPHKLVLMLFDGALLSINSAAISMTAGDVPAKGRNITRAIEIVSMGLKASLDMEAGGELAERLGHLYDYICERLLLANAQNNEGALAEVSRLLGELKDAWEQIGGSAAEAAA